MKEGTNKHAGLCQPMEEGKDKYSDLCESVGEGKDNKIIKFVLTCRDYIQAFLINIV
jgi:hypothetical protein